MIKTFKRYEKKFIIDAAKHSALLKKIAPYFELDEYCAGGVYNIRNIYYDTPDSKVIRHSLSKPYYKEKLRLRSYGCVKSPDQRVFLELKKKINKIVSKRRATMTMNEADNFLKYGMLPENTGYLDKQVLLEIRSFISRNNVRPAVFISYDRTAYFCRRDKELRITFDTNITARRNDLSLSSSRPGILLIDPGKYLMEIKFLRSVPAWLASILSELEIYSVSFSKYGSEYKLINSGERYAIAAAK